MQSISFYRWQFDKYVLILINIVWQNFITRRDFHLRYALGCSLLAFCYYFLSILISMYNVLQLCCLPISSCCYFCYRLCQWWHKTNTQETSWRGKKKWREGKVWELESHKHTVKVLSPSCVKVLPQSSNICYNATAVNGSMWGKSTVWQAGREAGGRADPLVNNIS